MLVSRDFAPDYAKWRIELDRDVALRESFSATTTVVTRTVYVGIQTLCGGNCRHDALFVPSPIEHTVDTLDVDPPQYYPIRPGHFTRFVDVRVAQK